MQYFDQSLAEQRFAATGASLRQEVDAAVRRLRALPDVRAASSPPPAKWSPKQVLGHLIDSASNNHQRFVRVQLVDGLAMPSYEQEQWIQSQHYQDESWKELVELWRSYNLHLAHIIMNIPDDRLHHRVKVGNGDPVTLRFIVDDYVTHLKHHLKQLFSD